MRSLHDFLSWLQKDHLLLELTRFSENVTCDLQGEAAAEDKTPPFLFKAHLLKMRKQSSNTEHEFTVTYCKKQA